MLLPAWHPRCNAFPCDLHRVGQYIGTQKPPCVLGFTWRHTLLHLHWELWLGQNRSVLTCILHQLMNDAGAISIRVNDMLQTGGQGLALPKGLH